MNGPFVGSCWLKVTPRRTFALYSRIEDLDRHRGALEEEITRYLHEAVDDAAAFHRRHLA